MTGGFQSDYVCERRGKFSSEEPTYSLLSWIAQYLKVRNKQNENPLFTTNCNEGEGEVNKTDFNKKAKILFSVDRKIQSNLTEQYEKSAPYYETKRI